MRAGAHTGRARARAVFVERRRAQEWRRARRACRARNHGARMGGAPLAAVDGVAAALCVRPRGELQFWYSAPHALAGVSPVLVVSLDNARVVDALAGDDLPVLTLHAPLKSAPAEHREWRLAAAHCKDADALRSSAAPASRTSFAGDSDGLRPVSPALSGDDVLRDGLCVLLVFGLRWLPKPV